MRATTRESDGKCGSGKYNFGKKDSPPGSELFGCRGISPAVDVLTPSRLMWSVQGDHLGHVLAHMNLLSEMFDRGVRRSLRRRRRAVQPKRARATSINAMLLLRTFCRFRAARYLARLFLALWMRRRWASLESAVPGVKRCWISLRGERAARKTSLLRWTGTANENSYR